jgi:hypothetical protein
MLFAIMTRMTTFATSLHPWYVIDLVMRAG